MTSTVFWHYTVISSWAAIKEMVYESPIQNVYVLLQRIMEAEIIQTSPDIFRRMRRSLLQRYVAWRNEDVGDFEHFLRLVN